MAKSTSINLVRKNERDFFEHFTNWALSSGRMIVYATFIIVLSALIYRVFLDREIIDLHDKIAQKQVFLKTLKKNEEKYLFLQQRLQNVATITTGSDIPVKAFTEIMNKKATDVTFSSLAVAKDSITMEADFKSAAALSSFVDMLNHIPQIKSLAINKIDNKLSTATISVSIVAKL